MRKTTTGWTADPRPVPIEEVQERLGAIAGRLRAVHAEVEAIAAALPPKSEDHDERRFGRLPHSALSQAWDYLRPYHSARLSEPIPPAWSDDSLLELVRNFERIAGNDNERRRAWQEENAFERRQRARQRQRGATAAAAPLLVLALLLAPRPTVAQDGRIGAELVAEGVVYRVRTITTLEEESAAESPARVRSAVYLELGVSAKHPSDDSESLRYTALRVDCAAVVDRCLVLQQNDRVAIRARLVGSGLLFRGEPERPPLVTELEVLGVAAETATER